MECIISSLNKITNLKKWRQVYKEIIMDQELYIKENSNLNCVVYKIMDGGDILPYLSCMKLGKSPSVGMNS